MFACFEIVGAFYLGHTFLYVLRSWISEINIIFTGVRYSCNWRSASPLNQRLDGKVISNNSFVMPSYEPFAMLRENISELPHITLMHFVHILEKYWKWFGWILKNNRPCNIYWHTSKQTYLKAFDPILIEITIET